MKEIKALIHRNRAADVVHALEQAGFRNLSLVDVRGTLPALDNQERNYSLELGESIITEVKLELVCEDEQAEEAVRLIRQHGRTGQETAGWVYLSEVSAAWSIP